MASLIYNKGLVVANGANGWHSGAATYKVLLVTGTYTPVKTHNFVADLTNELSGGGYARGTITTRSVQEDDANNRSNYLGDNVTFSGLSSTQTYRYIIIFRQVTNDADSELIAAIDVGASGVNLTGLTEHTIKWDNQATNGRAFSGSSP